MMKFSDDVWVFVRGFWLAGRWWFRTFAIPLKQVLWVFTWCPWQQWSSRWEWCSYYGRLQWQSIKVLFLFACYETREVMMGNFYASPLSEGVGFCKGLVSYFSDQETVLLCRVMWCEKWLLPQLTYVYNKKMVCVGVGFGCFLHPVGTHTICLKTHSQAHLAQGSRSCWLCCQRRWIVWACRVHRLELPQRKLQILLWPAVSAAWVCVSQNTLQ